MAYVPRLKSKYKEEDLDESDEEFSVTGSENQN